MSAHNCYVLSDKSQQFYTNLLLNQGVVKFRVYGESLFLGYRLVSVADDEWESAKVVLAPYLMPEGEG